MRELIICGEIISGDGEILSPLIILSAQIFLQNWIINNFSNNYLFAVSDTGYSNDEIYFNWV